MRFVVLVMAAITPARFFPEGADGACTTVGSAGD